MPNLSIRKRYKIKNCKNVTRFNDKSLQIYSQKLKIRENLVDQSIIIRLVECQISLIQLNIILNNSKIIKIKDFGLIIKY
jgi:hypothetical protein